MVVVVLLNNNLYWRNICCRYFGDFLAMSLVSWSMIIAGLLCSRKECRHGKEVFREEIFQVVRYVAGVVYSLLFIRGGGVDDRWWLYIT